MKVQADLDETKIVLVRIVQSMMSLGIPCKGHVISCTHTPVLCILSVDLCMGC